METLQHLCLSKLTPTQKQMLYENRGVFDVTSDFTIKVSLWIKDCGCEECSTETVTFRAHKAIIMDTSFYGEFPKSEDGGTLDLSGRLSGKLWKAVEAYVYTGSFPAGDSALSFGDLQTIYFNFWPDTGDLRMGMKLFEEKVSLIDVENCCSIYQDFQAEETIGEELKEHRQHVADFIVAHWSSVRKQWRLRRGELDQRHLKLIDATIAKFLKNCRCPEMEKLRKKKSSIAVKTMEGPK